METDRLNRREKINMVRLAYLIKWGLNHPLVSKGEEMRSMKSSTYRYDPVYTHISKLYSAAKKSADDESGFINSEFFQPHGESGRLNAVGNISLQTTSRPIRHFISGQYYEDIDIENCHVVLLYNYCLKNSILCEKLKKLITKRDDIYKEILTSNTNKCRDQVKTMFLALLNGGDADYKNFKVKTQFMTDFHNEINKIIDRIAELNADKLKEITKKRKDKGRDYNHKGAVMNLILQDMENQCLMVMEQVFMDAGIPLKYMVPIHDGMQIPKWLLTDDIKPLDELIIECMDRLSTELKLKRIKITVKPMDIYVNVMAENGLEYPSDDNLSIRENLRIASNGCIIQNPNHNFSPDDSISSVRSYYKNIVFDNMEDLVADVCATIHKVIRIVHKPESFLVNYGIVDDEWIIDLEPSINIRFYYVNKDSKSKPISSITLNQLLNNDYNVQMSIPEYSGIVFNPDPNFKGDTRYNMFSGFKASKVADINYELIKPILNHIYSCWCNYNNDIYDYVLQWFRHAFTKPHLKTGIVILLYSAEGTGKSMILDEFIRPFIYGSKNTLTVQGLTKLVARFNSLLMNRLLICSNEVSSNENFHNTFDTLKALITDKTFCPEKKGLDIFKDYPLPCNFIFTTNNHDSVKLGKTDRRYLCLEASSLYKGNFAYFDELAKSFNQEVADHFYTYIVNLPETRNIKCIPMTSLKEDMLNHAKTSYELFFDRVIESTKMSLESNNSESNNLTILVDEYISMDLKIHKDKSIWISSSQLYENYKKWCMSNGEKCKSNRDFGLALKKMTESKKSGGIIVYKVL
jgi:hypothetical protein